MSNPSYTNALSALEKRLANNLPNGFNLNSFKWFGVGNWETPSNANWGRLTAISFEDTTYAGGWTRFTGLFVLDLFFVYPSGGSIINQVGDVIEDLTELYTNAEFESVKTSNLQKIGIDGGSTHYGQQLNIKFSYEGKI